MSFAAGMAAGMGAGMGSGIAIGVAAGEKQARTKIQDCARLQGATIQNGAGKPLDWDEFLDTALGGSRRTRTTVLAWLLLLVGLAACAVALTVYLWLG